MAGTLNGLSHATLKLQGSASDTAGEAFSLLVEELLQEFRILVVDVLDTALLETAILFLFDIHSGGSELTDFRLCLCHD